MLFKKNRKPFTLRIDKNQAERERELFEGEPPEVKASLRLCKIFMAVFMPVGTVLSFLPNALVSVLVLLGAGLISFAFVKLKVAADRKLPFVPAICLVSGFLMGQFILKDSITKILG